MICVDFLGRTSISILEIELSRLSSRIDTNRQDLDRVFDLNSITRPDAINLI
jgi:hypothetical protein